MKQHRSDFPEEAELNYCNVDKVKFDLKEAPEPYGWGYNTSRFIPKKLNTYDEIGIERGKDNKNSKAKIFVN